MNKDHGSEALWFLSGVSLIKFFVYYLKAVGSLLSVSCCSCCVFGVLFLLLLFHHLLSSFLPSMAGTLGATVLVSCVCDH